MIASWLSLAYLLLATQHCLSYNQQRHNSPFQDVDDGGNSGPEDLLLEELVRNMKWAAANRRGDDELGQRFAFRKQQQQQQQLRPSDMFELLHDVDAMEEEEDADERFGYEFNAERPRQNTAKSGQQQHKSFALRPSDPGYYTDRQASVAELDPVIAPEPPVALPAVPAAASRNVNAAAGQKEDVLDEAPSETRQPVNEKFRPIVASTTPAPEQQRDTSDAVEVRAARDPVAHAMVSEPKSERAHGSLADLYLTALVAGCTASAVAALLGLGVCFYRWQRRAKAAQEVEYPAYGVTGPGPCQSGKSSLKSSPTSSTPGGTIGGWSLTKSSPKAAAQTGDKKLAHSAHMFHFQHQKQQVIALENSNAGCDRAGSNSGGESDEDNEEGDYTVYECPGLAPTGEMEVKNPLFLDDPTPASPALKRQSE